MYQVSFMMFTLKNFSDLFIKKKKKEKKKVTTSRLGLQPSSLRFSILPAFLQSRMC